MDFPKSVPGVGLVGGVFVDENPATGRAGSLMAAAWGNAVTEELLAVIRAAGIEPSEEDNSQLLEAIEALAGDGGNVKKTSDTGAALMPWGTDAQRPDTGDIPAGTLLVRGNAQVVAECRPEFYNWARQAWSAVGVPYVASVPAVFIGDEITVTKPHLRKMVWSTAQNKYLRAPWHQPCQLFFSYDNPTSVPGALPVRGDVSWQQADFPDVVERLGLSGAGTFVLAEARGEGLRVLDNGRGVDFGRGLGTAQLDAFQGHTFKVYGSGHTSSSVGVSFLGQQGGPLSLLGPLPDGANGTPRIASETRMRNVAFPLWMTF